MSPLPLPAHLQRGFMLICLMVMLTATADAQSRRKTAVRDTLRLDCLLTGYTVLPVQKSAIDPGQEDPSLIISSATDTLVKAPVDLVVSTIRRTVEGTYELVAYHQDYFFWITGIEQVKVYKNQPVKKGMPLGTMSTGAKLEILLYDFETPVDPAPFMTCKPL